MFIKLICVNLIFFVLTAFVSGRLRANLNRLTPDYDNQLTFLCTKTSIGILYQFAWIAVLFIASFVSIRLYAFVVSFMTIFALMSLFRFLSYCTPRKKAQILLDSDSASGYQFLLTISLLVFLSRVSLYCIATGTF